MWTTNLFFALEYAFYVDRKTVFSTKKRLKRLDMAKQLSFIVAAATSVEIVSHDDWNERGRSPFAERPSGQNIVVPVDKQRWAATSALPFAENNRVPAGVDDSNMIKSSLLQMTSEPARALSHIIGALRL